MWVTNFRRPSSSGCGDDGDYELRYRVVFRRVLYFSRNVGGVWVLHFSGTVVAGMGVAEGPDASGDGEGEKRLRRLRMLGFFFWILFIRKLYM